VARRKPVARKKTASRRKPGLDHVLWQLAALGEITGRGRELWTLTRS
jgi:hypothetical protein